jgi:hypothetical protein
LIREPFSKAYEYVKGWFGYHADMSLDLWVAPDVHHMQFMTCLPREESFFCATQDQNGKRVILFVSPRTCKINSDINRLAGLFAHEITHHMVAEISHATVYSMKRKQERDVPMWLEEGLGQLIQAELQPCFHKKCEAGIAGMSSWYDLEDLYNDLSCCDDVRIGYLQAYQETKRLLTAMGKSEIIRLLYLNRTDKINWNELLQ